MIQEPIDPSPLYFILDPGKACLCYRRTGSRPSASPQTLVYDVKKLTVD